MKKIIGLFFSIMFLVGTDTFLISPMLPLLQREFGVPTQQAGWMMGAYALGYALTAVAIGPLTDGWNRKTVLLTGLAGFAASTALCGLAWSFASMFAFRYLAGSFAAVIGPQVWASVPALVPGDRVVRAIGWVTAGLAVSQVLGVPLGSWLGASGRGLPFYAVGAAALLAGLLTLILLPDLPSSAPILSGRQAAEQTGDARLGNGTRTPAAGRLLCSGWSRYALLLADPAARRSFLAYFVFQAGNFSAFTFMGKWVSDRFGLSLSETGQVMFFIGLGQLAGSQLVAPAVKHFGQIKTLLLGLLLLIPLYAVLPASPNLGTAKLLYAVIFTVGGVLFPVMMTVLLSLNPSLRGTISSLTSAVMYAATALGSWLAGLIYAGLGGFQAVGLFTAACYVATPLLLRPKRSRVSSSARKPA